MAPVRTIADNCTIFAVEKSGDRQARSPHQTAAGGSPYKIRWWPGTIGVALVAILFSATVLAVIAVAEHKAKPPFATSSGKGDLLRRPETPNEPYAMVVTRGNGVVVLKRFR